MASLATALGLPQHWGDGAGLDGLDAAHHAELQREALVAFLRTQHEAGRPFAWLARNTLLSINPGRPLSGLHGDGEATRKKRIAHFERAAREEKRLQRKGPNKKRKIIT